MSPGEPVDEMQDAVVGPTEAVVGEDLVRIGGEVAIGEEQQFDDAKSMPSSLVRGVRIGFVGGGSSGIRCPVRDAAQIMSALLTYIFGRW